MEELAGLEGLIAYRHPPDTFQTRTKQPPDNPQDTSNNHIWLYLIKNFDPGIWSKFNFSTEKKSNQNHQMKGGGGCGRLCQN